MRTVVGVPADHVGLILRLVTFVELVTLNVVVRAVKVVVSDVSANDVTWVVAVFVPFRLEIETRLQPATDEA